jgi:DNA repair exonuclease SbcCD ATPase subunit
MERVDQVEASLRAVETSVERQVGEYRHLLQEGAAAEQEVERLEQEIAVLDQAIAVLNSYADERQEDLQRRVEEMVTHGLRLVFDDQDLEFRLSPGTRGKYATMEFVLRTRKGEDWIETPVMDAAGGGVAAVVGFVLRVVLLMLRADTRKVLLLDETFAQLSAEYEPRLAEFIRELVDRTGMQVIMVTHSSAYDEAADTAYRLSLSEGVTQVERVS